MVLRGIWRYKAFSAINIMGLAIGISCCLLILLYVQFELSYDRYHEKADRIYRTSIQGVLAGNEINAAVSPYPMAAALVREYPEVEAAARFRRFFQEMLVSIEDINYQEREIFHADPSFFEIFSYQFLAGDPATALIDPNTVVLTESIANKYFGDSPALGQTLTFNNDREYLVTGVIEDVPENTHFHPELLVSFTSDPEHDSPNWVSNNISTYFLLRPDVSASEFYDKLQEAVEKFVAPQIEAVLGASFSDFLNTGGRYEYGMQPLNDIHLYSNMEAELEQNGNAAYVYTFLAVALFVLLLACINFMNLSTARSSIRAREIGVRKVMGAYRQQLLVQFLTESILISLFALLIAIPIVALLLEPFSALTDRPMSLDSILNLPTLGLLLLFTVLVGLVSGSYPAFFLSRYHPQEVLKGTLSKGAKSAWFRSGLVVFQFTISIALVSATLIVYSQLNYMRTKALGFEKEQLLVIHRATALGEQLESFKEQLSRLPSVISISSSTHVPGEQVNQNVYVLEGQPMTDTKAIWSMRIGYDYIETLGIELLDGRDFSREFSSDESAYVINETAAREFGIDDPTQHKLLEPDPDGMRSGQIVGLIKDFHFQSLHQEIRPMMLQLGEFTRYVLVRVSPDSIQSTVSDIENEWNQTTSDQPFEYSFLDADFEQLYQGDRKMGEVFVGFSILAVLIACLGLYGLASFTTEQRTKEIGIRKTLGASTTNIVMMIAKEFILLVVVALVIAIPLAYFTMNEWLQLFSYRIAIPANAFVTSGFLALVIAFATISFQSIKTANTNPALTLRDE